MKMFRILLCVAGVLFSVARARANVYATDIQINGSFATITNAGPVTISYRLNQAASLGVTVAVMQGTNPVATINGGTNMGLNTVVWGGTNNSGAPAGAGTYSFDIIAAASGFTNWEQISVDTNAGNFAAAPNGLAVDNNTNSPYYGRVVVGCSTEGSQGSGTNDGLYKLNADGSFADEGGFGYGAYTNDDAGHASVHPGEMPSFSGVVPWRLRIGDDDRIYMLDFSQAGAVVAFDMLATTNQIVIDDGGTLGGHLGGPHNYASNPDKNDLIQGINNFDVTSTATTNAAIWLCNYDSPPNWGIWMYHLTNGASDPNDTEGTQAVTTGGDLSSGSSGGCMVDTNLDIFCGQSFVVEQAAYDAMVFTNWNGGFLPPEKGGTNYALGAQAGEVLWGFGCSVDTTCATDPTFEAVQDVVINSRTSPTIVACPMGSINEVTVGSGIRLLNAANGSVITVTNGSGAVIQTLTNLDFGQDYATAAWDNVGNLYGASTSRQLWRVWSPPGANTNSTVALAQVVLSAQAIMTINITSIRTSPTTPGCANVTITFTASGNLAPSAFTLVGASDLKGTYSAVSGAVLTGGAGSYQATFSNCSTEFYKIALTLAITGLKASPTTSGCATVTITFTAPGSLAPSAFTLVGASDLKGTYSAVSGAVMTGNAGSYKATFSNCSTQFYKIKGPGL
jgi:hypothetical protein